MDIIKDIAKIVKYDTEHDVEIKVDSMGVSVYLIYDREITEDEIIPIRYETLEEFAYINHKEYMDIFHPKDFGITLEEINIVQKIMTYLERHKKEISELCDSLNCYHKKSLNSKSE